jgi:Ca2+-dependent lipid-binding protein
LADLEPFVSVERIVNLQHTKLGNKASIRLRFLFTPEVITKSRKPTSTFSTAGRAMTQIGAAPVGVGKGVVSGVGAGVGVVGKGVMSIFKKEGSKTITEEQLAQGVLSASPDLGSDPQLVQNGAAGGSAVAGSSAVAHSSPPIPSVNSVKVPGKLRVEVIGGHDLMAPDGDQVRPYVIASVGETEYKTKHVSKTNAPVWCVTD